MPHAEEGPGKMGAVPGRWRSGATFQELLDHMDEFWQSPQGQRLQAARQAAEVELQAWLAEQPDVVVHRHGGQVPEQWEGEVDGHSFYFRERSGEWDIELDLRERDHNVTRGDVIATGTIAAEGYGQSPRERAAFIVTTVRDHLRRKEGADAARTGYAYRVEWSPADSEFVGLVAEFPSLSWLAPTRDEAMRGIVGVVEQIVADNHGTGNGGNA